MKHKAITLLTLLGLVGGTIGLSSLANTNTNVALAENTSNNATFINRRSETIGGSAVATIATTNPWVAGANVEFKLTNATAFDSTYLALDLDVTQSINNPEAVVKLGVNGQVFEGVDGVDIPGNPTGVRKQWGNWFFITKGRKTLFIKVADFLANVNEITSFNIWFDTGVPGRGVEMKVYGLYATNELATTGQSNLLTLSSEKVTTTGTTITYANENEENIIAFDGVQSNTSLHNNVALHIKSAAEGGVASTDGNRAYSYLTFDVNGNNYALNNANGLAFDYATHAGECYTRILIEDNNGQVYMPQMDNISYATSYNGVVNRTNAAGLYTAIHLLDKTRGTTYLPYSIFNPINNFQGKNISVDKPMGTLSKVHIGFDMMYGLGRNLSFGNFYHVEPNQNKITSIADLTKESTIRLNEEEVLKDNFVINKYVAKDLYVLASDDVENKQGKFGSENITFARCKINGHKVNFLENGEDVTLYRAHDVNTLPLTDESKVSVDDKELQVGLLNESKILDARGATLLLDAANAIDLVDALNYAVTSIYSDSWRDNSASVCNILANETQLNDVISGYDALSNGAKAIVDKLNDSTSTYANVTLGDTIAMLKLHKANAETNSKFIDSFAKDSMILLVVGGGLITLAAICLLIIRRRKHLVE